MQHTTRVNHRHSMMTSLTVPPLKQKAYLIFESALLLLFNLCIYCGCSSTRIKKMVTGTFLRITQVCIRCSRIRVSHTLVEHLLEIFDYQLRSFSLVLYLHKLFECLAFSTVQPLVKRHSFVINLTPCSQLLLRFGHHGQVQRSTKGFTACWGWAVR